ncbi:nuclear transport factor 2 family protein [Planctomicrobium piriforme]|uniref:DUF4440 domain-containing protein n=1 Tax=Planctomicrobium piriforme TaxID=1576369 RepID=A0A1I3PT13_9PLAN|nr:nuclear transport factor 2 family protein [Planctomicrobium piriforme]SFJ24629.1 conserved hypothetical protein [Planctomicrobium piriforme]
MWTRLGCVAALMMCAAVGWTSGIVQAADDPQAEIKGVGEKVVAAFNAGKADELAALFLPQGEWIDENGVVYMGREEIQEILTAYFQKYTGAKMAVTPDSIRPVGPVAIEEGVREITAGKEQGTAQLRYIAVFAKSDVGWQIASVRDFTNDPAPTPHDYLKPLEWLVGDWVNEGADAHVQITYRWSDDGNFLLGDYHVIRDGKEVMNSSQRVAWDPLAGKVRSWMFDSDGGFAESTWTNVENDWVLKSQAVMPDGLTGSATITISKADKDRFTMSGSDRIVGTMWDDDFEVTVVRKLTRASK